MQRDREELVKRVFPELRELCESRGVAFSEVDLRWGVTDEQRADGAVLPVCLAEIERSRPYFIGMLGERYGWVPDQIPADLAARVGWLEDHAGRSVTELEILHGVLDSIESGGHAYFYLRHPEWLETLSPEERAALEETDPSKRRLLAELKARLRASGHPCRDYPDPVALGRLVLADFTALVEQLYPEEHPPGLLARQRLEHSAFRISHHPLPVDRPAEVARIAAHVEGEGPPLAVTGPAGIGTSALLATWVAGHVAAYPDDLVIEHHVGATAASADWIAMVGRIAAEAAIAAGRPAPEPPADEDEARRSLADALRSWTGPRRLVLAIDGLDELTDTDEADSLAWFPLHLGPAVRAVVSTGPGPTLEAVMFRGWPTLAVAPLERDEKRAITERFLARFVKALGRDHLDRIVDSPETASPLILVTLLDELRQHGDHFTLGDLIDRHLAAARTHDTFARLLERWEQDYERDRPGLVGEAFTLLWAARHGLEEAELLDLLGDAAGPLPSAAWSPLFLAAEAHLVLHSGLLVLGHAALREDVCQRYLATPDQRQAAHARLATYFGSRVTGLRGPNAVTGLRGPNAVAGPRVLDELPWAKAAAGEWDGLVAALADPTFLVALTERDALVVRRLWRLVEDEGGRSMADAYGPLVDDLNPDTVDAAWTAAVLLMFAGHTVLAARLQSGLADLLRAAGDVRRLGALLVNLAATHAQSGDARAALAAATEAESLARGGVAEGMLERALNAKVLALRQLGRHDEALSVSFEEERGCRRSDDPVALAACLSARSGVLLATGDPDGALELMREQERLDREGGDLSAAAQALGAQATVLAGRGDTAAALSLVARQEDALRQLGARAELVTAIANRASMQRSTGDHSAADASLAEAEDLARRAGRRAETARVLSLRAVGAHAQGRRDEAGRLALAAEAIARPTGAPEQVALALEMRVVLAREAGDLATATALLDEQEALYRATGSQLGLANVAANRGNIAVGAGDHAGALRAWAGAEIGYRASGEVLNLLPLLHNRYQVRLAAGDAAGAAADLRARAELATAVGRSDLTRESAAAGVQLLYQLGRQAECEVLFQLLADACRRLGDDNGLQQALGDHALLLLGRGDASAAEAIVDEQEAVCRRLGDPGRIGLQACTGNRAILRKQQGRLEEALACLAEQESICRAIGHGQGLLIAVANRGDVLTGIPGRAAEAVAALEAARSMAMQLQLTPMIAELERMLAQARSAG